MPAIKSVPVFDTQLESQFEDRIKLLCDFFKLSCSDLDNQAGLSLGTCKKLVDAKQRIYASHLIRIATATGVDLDYFYNPDATLPSSASPPHREALRLVEAYQRIERTMIQRDVFELVEALMDNPQKK